MICLCFIRHCFTLPCCAHSIYPVLCIIIIIQKKCNNNNNNNNNKMISLLFSIIKKYNVYKEIFNLMWIIRSKCLNQMKK